MSSVQLMQTVVMASGLERMCRVTNITKTKFGYVGKIRMDHKSVPVFRQWRAKAWKETVESTPEPVAV